MSAIAEAKELYAKHGLCFERDLCHYLQHGIVVAHPDRFLMAKPINKELGDDVWNPEAKDTWYVHVAVGANCLKWFLEQAPYQLPFLAWRRWKAKGNALKYYPTKSFARFVS